MKSYSKENQQFLNDIARTKYKNEYPCDLYGRFPWDCERRGDQIGRCVSLSKNCLGIFVYEVLKRGGNITSFYVFALSNGAAVFPRVWLTLEEYEKFFGDTGFILNAPSVAHVN